ncbi:MAG TPA: VCBS repeat-containing protein [Phycisphaerae bacterium]
MVIGDVDGDGDLDLATVSNEIVSVVFNQGDATFAPPMHYSINFTQPGNLYDGYKLDLGDLDHDGDLDMAVGQMALGQVVIMMNNGDGIFGPLLTYPADDFEPVVVDFGDMNGDGTLDLTVFVVNSWQSRLLCVLLNDGTGKLLTDQESHNWWAPPSPYWPNPRQIGFTDIDGDADLDVVVLNQGDPFVPVYLANFAVVRNLGGGVLAQPVHYPISGSYPFSMRVGDLDGDGDEDIVTCGPADYSQATGT